MKKCQQLLEKNKKFKKATENIDLTTLLMLPLTQIPKYILTVKEIIKNTSNEHVEFEKLHDSLKNLNSIDLEIYDFIIDVICIGTSENGVSEVN